MSANRLACPECELQVDAAQDAAPLESGQGKRFTRYIRCKPARRQFGHRETYPAHRDAVTDSCGAQIERATFDHESQVATALLARADCSDALDNSGEHPLLCLAHGDDPDIRADSAHILKVQLDALFE